MFLIVEDQCKEDSRLHFVVSDTLYLYFRQMLQ